MSILVGTWMIVLGESLRIKRFGDEMGCISSMPITSKGISLGETVYGLRLCLMTSVI